MPQSQSQSQSMRVPPQNLEAEMSALGCILLDQEKITSVYEIVKPEDFYSEVNKEVYLAMLDLFNKSEPIDILTVGDRLKMRGSLAKIGGMEHLGELVYVVPAPENARYYAKIVAEKSMLRTLIKACSKVVEDSYLVNQEADAIVERAEDAIFGIMEDRNRAGVVHVKEVIIEIYEMLNELYNRKGKLTGVPTGFYWLDDKTSGLHNSDLILLAARPSMGKSSLALNIAHNVAVRAGLPVMFFSLEMTRAQLVSRMICADEMIDAGRMRSGKLLDEDWQKVALATSRLMDAPFYIDHTSTLTVTDIKAKCRRQKLEKGLGLVVIDYLQLMQGGARSENRQQEISEISRSLKLMARELNVPVLALSQLSRAPENRTDHRPILSDLRESGAIEQDADIVMFLYRDEAYNPDTESPGLAELIIAKHRNGETGKIDLKWMGNYTKFATPDNIY
ncbi:MAG: replicative DNA helicase [Oscillospiraceae bacterium]|nr:replicative DNA helicase [Oscillospiraceae bacterium]